MSKQPGFQPAARCIDIAPHAAPQRTAGERTPGSEEP
jgi:hypothetical protein